VCAPAKEGRRASGAGIAAWLLCVCGVGEGMTGGAGVTVRGDGDAGRAWSASVGGARWLGRSVRVGVGPEEKKAERGAVVRVGRDGLVWAERGESGSGHC
jgi:hypothetical protein